jgi:hypothetical protein
MGRRHCALKEKKMADVKICDRCGKRLGEERAVISFMPVTSRCVLNVSLIKKPRAWGYDNITNTSHDLCINCTKKLAECLEYGETEGNT